MRRAVRDFMRRERLKQTDAATRLGISQTMVSAIVGGSVRRQGPQLLSIETAWRIAKPLGMSVERLVDGTGNILPPKAIPGWDEAEQEARAAYPYIPDAAWDVAREGRWPARVTAQLAKALADELGSRAQRAPPGEVSPSRPSRGAGHAEGVDNSGPHA